MLQGFAPTSGILERRGGHAELVTWKELFPTCPKIWSSARDRFCVVLNPCGAVTEDLSLRISKASGFTLWSSKSLHPKAGIGEHLQKV